ncbi:MAG: BadF/BadG/BcrA/BcrD ATPase family protein [Anaerolineales bacterium]|jgi:N-acetylglucosamine kinase-like BadF-type ATPase
MRYFLGADLGGTKTHLVVADEGGTVLGFGESGPANHQSVGFEGMFYSLDAALNQALSAAGLHKEQLSGAGFGIAGYDWPSQLAQMSETIDRLGLRARKGIFNDTIPGLVAGAEEGWGVVVVSGTGCNCRGWDRVHRREGRVTGYGDMMGEAAGATELVHRAMQLVSFEWTQRGPATALSRVLLEQLKARNLEDLLEGYTEGRYTIAADLAPTILAVAQQGDTVAQGLVAWAGQELGEMANAVIRQLGFESLAFDVVLSGSLFEGGRLLIDPMRETILMVAAEARLVRLTVPPVIGAVLIGMEQDGLRLDSMVRKTLAETLDAVRQPFDSH